MVAQAERLVLYSAQGCPFAQRARIALIASGAKYETVEIDLQNKPSWYAPVINPASKVPAITYGAPLDSDVSSPPPETFRLPESALVVNFVASLFPKIEYSDPVLRAKGALLALQYDALVGKAWNGYFRSTEGNLQPVLDAIREFQPYIGKEFTEGKEYGTSDILLAPFIGRIFLFSKAGDELNGLWPSGAGSRLLSALEEEEFVPFKKLADRLGSWEAYKASFDAGYLVKGTRDRFTAQKEKEKKEQEQKA